MTTARKSAPQVPAEELTATAKVLPLPQGTYYCSVKSAAPHMAPEAGNLMLPAVQLSIGPGLSPADAELIPGPTNRGAWLCQMGDTLIAKISAPTASLVLLSLRGATQEALAINIERLESRAPGAIAPPLKLAAAQPGPSNVTKLRPGKSGHGKSGPGKAAAVAQPAPPAQDRFRAAINAHVRNRGDMKFADVPWAGLVASGLSIEAFSVAPLAGFDIAELEYKGLTASGFETPWITNGETCGTKGMGVPLIGFAIRPKSGGRPASFDCEYSGRFQSGQTAGPLRNGAPCRSSVPGDALEAIQLRLIEKGASAKATPRPAVTAPSGREKSRGGGAKPAPQKTPTKSHAKKVAASASRKSALKPTSSKRKR